MLVVCIEHKLESFVVELGDGVVGVVCDVIELCDQAKVVWVACDAFGWLDVAFVNAGIGSLCGFIEGIVE